MPERQGMAGQAHGVGERAAAGPDQHALARQASRTAASSSSIRSSTANELASQWCRTTKPWHPRPGANAGAPGTTRVRLQVLIHRGQHRAPDAGDLPMGRAVRRRGPTSVLRSWSPPRSDPLEPPACLLACPRRRGKGAAMVPMQAGSRGGRPAQPGKVRCGERSTGYQGLCPTRVGPGVSEPGALGVAHSQPTGS